MDIDFLRREKKLKAEQANIRRKAKTKLENEKKLQQIASQQTTLIEEKLRQRRIELASQEEKRKKLEEENARRTGGIHFTSVLKVQLSSSEGDKVILPQSALITLTEQNALSFGPLLFQITHNDKNRNEISVTHAGVLEFVADEGIVKLPTKVAKSLSLEEETLENSEVEVKYVMLPKGKYCKVVPLSEGLSVVPNIKLMLENNLRNHSALTQNDWLEVWYRGKRFELKVTELRPESAVTIINSDLEIEIDIPAKAKAKFDEIEIENRSKTIGKSSGASKEKFRRSEIESDNSESESSEDEFDLQKHQEKMRNSLPAEPKSDEKRITIQARWRGGRSTRSFRPNDQLVHLFNFCEASVGIPPNSYKVVVAFPRREFIREKHQVMTFEDVGIVSKQETVTIEPFL